MLLYIYDRHKPKDIDLFKVDEIQDINVDKINPDWKADVFKRHIYEITLTFNPKYFPNAEYAYDYIEYYHMKLLYKILPNHNNTLGEILIINTEFHKNGFPHLHGIIYSSYKWANTKIHNVEQFFNREMGRCSIYYTEYKDKYHTTPEMYWSKYIIKEGKNKYQQYFINRKEIYAFNYDEIKYYV